MNNNNVPTSDSRFPELTRLVKSGNCVAFVGAGMSRPLYPGWEELVKRLCDACDIDLGTFLTGKTRPPLTEIADLAFKKNKSTYCEALRKIFCRHEPTHRYHLLAKLPFKVYLTTNYDSLLLDACRVQQGCGSAAYSVYPELKVADQRKGEVVFLHGRIDHESSDQNLGLVLTNTEFAHAYSVTLLRSFLEQFLSFNSVCFLGCGLTDDYLNNVFLTCKRYRESCGSQHNRNAPHWFILVDESDTPSAEWEQAGIEIVRYQKLNDDYDGLRHILEYWADVHPAERRPMFEDVSYDQTVEVSR